MPLTNSGSPATSANRISSGEPAAITVPADRGPRSISASPRFSRVSVWHGLRLRLTLLATALLALVGALLLALAYLLVGRVVAALPHFPAGTPVQVNGVTVDAAVEAARVVEQGRSTVLVVGLIAFPLLVITGGLLSWVLIGRALRPLSTLTSAARALSESSLDQRIALTGPRDEVAELADTFDEMLGRLQAAFEAERRFVANASHELRTPLSVIRTEVDVTLADPDAGVADLRRMGEVAREGTERADRLLSSLLFLARTQASGLSVVQDVDLAALVGPALLAVDAELTARRLAVEVSGEAAVVAGDPALLERVVGNLVENAVRHNLPGGRVSIRTGTSDAFGFIEVTSGGTVIDPATVAQLFEPFRQGERARTGHRGSGLGLSIVSAVVSAHSGTVVAAPVEGGGLRVRVQVPT
jgi:signal transduction histidine kinase